MKFNFFGRFNIGARRLMEERLRQSSEEYRHVLNELQEKEQKLTDTVAELETSNDELRASKAELETVMGELETQRQITTAERDRLHTIIQEMGEGVLVINEKCAVEMMNKGVISMFGYSKEEDFPIGYKKFFVERLSKEIYSTDKTTVRREIELQRPKEMFLMITIAKLSPEKKHGGFVAVLRDITFEKKLDKMRSDFVSNVAHEIRSPMAPMKEALALVLDGIAGPVSAEQKRFLQIMDNNMERLLRLINDLLDLTKIEAGKMEVRKFHTDLSVLLRETVDTFSLYATKKGVNLQLRLPEGLPLVLCDKDRITQVVVNLIVNAVKFTPSGGSVTVESRRFKPYSGAPESIGDFAEVSVTDTGPGIDLNEAANIFDRFEQLTSGFAEGRKGSGLGLAISKAIVELHEGKIWVESQPGKGSAFKFILPLGDGK